MFDFNIDNETFANAYGCLIEATDMLKAGLGDFSELNGSALELINKGNGKDKSGSRLKNISKECMDLGERMRTTIVGLSAMDADANTYFEDRFGDLSKSFEDRFEDADEANPTSAIDTSEILTFADFFKHLSSDDLALLGIDVTFVPDFYACFAVTEGFANVLENYFDAGLKSGSEMDALELAQMSDTYAIFSSLLGDEKYSSMSDLLASRSDELRTSTDIAKMIAVDNSGNFINSLVGDEKISDNLVYDILVNVSEYSPALLAKAFGGEYAQAVAVASSTYGSKLESGYAAAIANAEREGREFTEADVLNVDVRATSQAAVDAAIILAAGGVKDIGKTEKDLEAVYAGASYYVKSTKPFVNEAMDTYVFKVDETNDKGEKGPDGIVDSYNLNKAFIDSNVILASEAIADISSKVVSSISTAEKPLSNNLFDTDVEVELSGSDKVGVSEIVNVANKFSNEIGKRYIKDTVKIINGEFNK